MNFVRHTDKSVMCHPLLFAVDSDGFSLQNAVLM